MVVFYSAVQITSNLMEEKKASAWNDLPKVRMLDDQLVDRRITEITDCLISLV